MSESKGGKEEGGGAVNGYVKLYRKLLDWEWFKDSNALHVFMFLLLNANWKATRWKGEELQPGQLVTSVISICKGTGITPQSVRTSLNRLKSTNELTIKTTNKYTLITIANWASYQSDDDELTNKSTSTLTNNQQTTNKQLTTAKEGKNIKKISTVQKGTQLTPQKLKKMTEQFTPEFEAFWNLYPKQIGKKVTFENWVRRLHDGEFVEDIMKATANYITFCEANYSDLKYMKDPARFIGDERWYCDFIGGIPEVQMNGKNGKAVSVSKYVDQ